ncbi:hypothetical protein GCM10028791_20090 [Echinicola sediminis]
MESNKVLGVDVGGSHITVGAVDMEARIVEQNRLVRRAVNSKGTVEEIIASWAGAMAPLFGNDLSAVRIGIAMPGPFDYDAGISWIDSTQDKYEALHGKNVKKLLAEALGIKPVQIRFKNDAASFLQGEIFAGIAKGYKSAIGITLGTGAGTAYYHGTEAHDAARWGDAFGESIVEEYFSTRWFIKQYKERTGEVLKGVKELVEIKEQAWVQALFKEFGRNLGDFLETFISEEKPEIVVLGGSIAHSSDLFLAETEKKVYRQFEKVKIKKSTLGEQSALIGAASCWYEEYN